MAKATKVEYITNGAYFCSRLVRRRRAKDSFFGQGFCQPAR